jgi:hypothetical protein
LREKTSYSRGKLTASQNEWYEASMVYCLKETVQRQRSLPLGVGTEILWFGTVLGTKEIGMRHNNAVWAQTNGMREVVKLFIRYFFGTYDSVFILRVFSSPNPQLSEAAEPE